MAVSNNKFKIIKINNKSTTTSYLSGLESQLTWIKNQIAYYSFLKDYRLKLNCLRGEIYEIDFGVNVNAEFSFRHYGLVLKDSPENNPLVLVCPLKTNKNGPNPSSDLDLGLLEALNSSQKTLAVYNQIRTIDKIRIYKDRLINIDNKATSESAIIKEYRYSVPKVSYQVVDRILDAYWQMIDESKISK